LNSGYPKKLYDHTVSAEPVEARSSVKRDSRNLKTPFDRLRANGIISRSCDQLTVKTSA
jgi:hypothetical protein